jgi:hypothetical protein
LKKEWQAAALIAPIWCVQSAGSSGCAGGWVRRIRSSGEVLGVGVRESVKVSLGGGELSVPHTVHHRFQVGAAGEQPGGVRVAQVVDADADAEVDAGGGDGGPPLQGLVIEAYGRGSALLRACAIRSFKMTCEAAFRHARGDCSPRFSMPQPWLRRCRTTLPVS